MELSQYSKTLKWKSGISLDQSRGKENHPPRHTGYGPFDAAQDMAGFLG